MERRTISVASNENAFAKIEQNKCNELLINSILEPLLDIIYQYKDSQAYNYVPGTSTDSNAGWEYYGKKFRGIYKAINKNIFLSEYEYRKIYEIVQGVQSFTRKFSDADGLPDSFFEANQNLNFYTFAFSEDGKQCRAYLKFKQDNGPTEREYLMSDAYHGRNNIRNEELNLNFDRDDFFIEELAYTVRLMFIQIITESSKK